MIPSVEQREWQRAAIAGALLFRETQHIISCKKCKADIIEDPYVFWNNISDELVDFCNEGPLNRREFEMLLSVSERLKDAKTKMRVSMEEEDKGGL